MSNNPHSWSSPANRAEPKTPRTAMAMTDPLGLLLLTGGQGRRLGGPKHGRGHPLGGSWGGQLVAVFEALCPDGPIQLLGEALPDRPELANRPDSGRGPALALVGWAGWAARPRAMRWWLVACDQVRWTAPALAAWLARTQAADPDAEAWVMAMHEGYPQLLGGVLADALVPRLAQLSVPSLRGLAQALPTRVLEAQGEPWDDVDTPEALRAWRASPPG